MDLAEGRWVDDGSLLGRTYLNVRLANGVQLSDVRPTSLTPAPTPVDLPAPRMAHPPTTAAALPAARTTPTAARGPALTERRRRTPMSSEPTPTTPQAVDLLAVLADFQTQLTALNQAMTAQQATIDALVDEVIDLIKARDDAEQ